MLNDTQIKNLKPKEKLYRVTDALGLRIEINPNGTKIWRYVFRWKGKYTMLSLGHYPNTSLRKARQLRDDYKQMLQEGINPKHNNTKNDSKQKQPTFKEIFHMWHQTMSKQWSNDYSIDTQQRGDMYLLPQLGKLPITAIKIGLIRDLLLDIQDTGKLDTVKKIKGIVTRVLGYAVSREVIEINVALSLSPDLFIKKPEKHYAHAKTPQALKSVLLKLERVSSGQSVKTALMLVPHLLLRPSEVAELKWEYFDFNERMIIIPAEAMKIKKKIHHVPLSNTTFLIFRNLKSMSLDSPFCFPSPTNRNKAIAPESLNKSMRSVGISKEQFTAHGNRHTAATIIGNHLPNVRSEVVDAQLHHTISGVSGIYNQADYLDERKTMMKDWSNYLNDLLT